MKPSDAFLKPARKTARDRLTDAEPIRHAVLSRTARFDRSVESFLAGRSLPQMAELLLAELAAQRGATYAVALAPAVDDLGWPCMSVLAFVDARLDVPGVPATPGTPAQVDLPDPASPIGQALAQPTTFVAADLADLTDCPGLPPGHPPVRNLLCQPAPGGDDGSGAAGLIVLVNGDGGYDPLAVGAARPTLDALCLLLVAQHERSQRQRLQAEAARSDEQTRRLASIAALTATAVIVGGPDDGAVWVNDAFERMTGFTIDDVRGKQPHELLLHPQIDPTAAEYVAAMIAGGDDALGVEVQNVAKDGRAYRAIVDVRLVRNDAGAVTSIISFHTDVTMEHTARDRAEAAETRMRLSLEALPDGFVMYDRDDRLVMCNSRYIELYRRSADLIKPGVRFEEILREGLRRGQYPEAVGREQAWLAERMRTHAAAAGSVEQRTPDDRWVLITERHTADGGTVGFRVDITELKQAKERAEAAAAELQAQQAKFSAAFQVSVDLMKITRLSDGRIVELNDAWERMTGYTRAEGMGKTGAELALWDEPPVHKQMLDQLQRHQRALEVPTRLRRRDGKLLQVVASAALVDIGGEPCSVWTVRDTTAQHAADASVRELNRKLETSVAELKAKNDRDARLSEMRDLLQACQTPAEVYTVAQHFAPKLLPDTRGALYLLKDSKSTLEAVCAWDGTGGDARALSDLVFAPDACWALRRGRPYHVADLQNGLACGHVAESRGACLCLPMSGQGETGGILHVHFATDEPPARSDADGAFGAAGSGTEREDFLQTMTEHIQLALSNAHLRENLREQATHDALTGMVNRRHMDESFERELRRARRRGQAVAVIMADIDHFKKYNDRYGHDAGDYVLQLVATELARGVRTEDYVCRYGGEEFLLLLPDADSSVATMRAEALRARVAALTPTFRGQSLGALTISLGVSAYPLHADAREALVKAADAALYRAKHRGRNRVEAAGEDTAPTPDDATAAVGDATTATTH